MKEFWCDLETTGVDPNKHGVWQIAFIIVAGEHRVELSYTMKPPHGDTIDPRALKVGGITEDELNKFPNPKQVFEDMKKELRVWVDPFDTHDKFFFYGYNARFDADFLRRFFEKMGDKFYGSWFWSPPLDIMSIAAYNLRDSRDTMLDFKLRTVAKFVGIEVDDKKTHDALYDIQLTRELLSRIERR